MQPGSSAAARYAELRRNGRVGERSLFAVARTPGELELQARWFAGDFGRRFRSACDREIEIVQFGTWNREAGPDFQDAVIRIDGGEPLRGSIEFDLADRNWELHGHSLNPAFEETVLHVFVHASRETFFTRTASHRSVTQVRVDPATLPDAFSGAVPLARPGRCQAPLGQLPEDRVRSVVAAAARFRLQRKASRAASMIEIHGFDEALFQEIATALGYKQNKLPFALLAQRLTIRTLRAAPDDAEAALFGVAGFLEAPDLGAFSGDVRPYLRELWDRWWHQRNGCERLVLPRDSWRTSGSRPVNHPQRRIGALAAIVRRWPECAAAVKSSTPLPAMRTFLLELDHPFWRTHYTLTAAPAAKPMAVVGESRIAEILANVVAPIALATGSDIQAAYDELPAKLDNRRLATAAARLFGDIPSRRKFVRTVAQQQGLLQIYEDFCLQDNSDCAHCPFPEQMSRWTM